MRFVIMLAAMAALWVTPASAAVPLPAGEPADILFLLTAEATGMRNETHCFTGPECETVTPFERTYVFQITVSASNFVNGVANFSYGNGYFFPGFTTGIIEHLGNAEFTGTNLKIHFESGHGNNCLCYIDNAAAPTFSVFQYNAPVPEPATWAMMLFGFAAIGSGLRRRHRSGQQQAMLEIAH